jgi:hypothetical protein
MINKYNYPFLSITGLSLPSQCSDIINPKLSTVKLTIPRLPYNLLPVSCGDIGPKSSNGLKVPLGSSCPLQTILLSDLVGCDSPLQIIMAVWRAVFLNFQACCHAQLDGQHCPLRTFHGLFFSRAEKHSEDITGCLFLMNMKGLIIVPLYLEPCVGN